MITDADPVSEADETGETLAVYPTFDEEIRVSNNTARMKKNEDSLVKVFCGLKTLEYDLALVDVNRTAMLAALRNMHPRIAQDLQTKVEEEEGDAAKARTLFSGMFERKQNNVQKGRFGQSLAQVIAEGNAFVVPDYIQNACQTAEAK